MVWGIASERSSETYEAVVAFVDYYDLTFPVLWDSDASVFETYDQHNPEGGVYPQEWIIGVDGRVRYVANYYDARQVIEIVEEELAKMTPR